MGKDAENMLPFLINVLKTSHRERVTAIMPRPSYLDTVAFTYRHL